MSGFSYNLTTYEEGVNDGIEQGHHILLLKLLTKKFGYISEAYSILIEDLDIDTITNIALNIFEINRIDDLDNYLPINN